MMEKEKESSSTPPTQNAVQCGFCGKWREFPAHVEINTSDTDIWQCKDNTWDMYNNCDIEQDSDISDDDYSENESISSNDTWSTDDGTVSSNNSINNFIVSDNDIEYIEDGNDSEYSD
jgi:hypothetical protein